MSRVPCRISPAAGFFIIMALHSTRMTMEEKYTPLE